MSTLNIWKVGELGSSLAPQRGNGRAVKIILAQHLLVHVHAHPGHIGIVLHCGIARCLKSIAGRWKKGFRILRAIGASDSDVQLVRWIFHWRCPEKLWSPFLRCLLFLMNCIRILYPIILQCLDSILKGLLFLSQKRLFCVLCSKEDWITAMNFKGTENLVLKRAEGVSEKTIKIKASLDVFITAEKMRCQIAREFW